MALGQKNFVDFVDRFQKLRQQRDTADALVRVCASATALLPLHH